MTLDDFCLHLDAIIDAMPQAYFKRLNGGVNVSEAIKYHDLAKNNDLFVLGTYHRGGHMGRYIVLYLGSLNALFSKRSDAAFMAKAKEVLEHELTHHWESLAGEKDLEDEDDVALSAYLASHA